MSKNASTTAHITLEVLGKVAFRFNNEHELQEGITLALTAAGVVFKREVVLTPRDRIDFLVGEGVGVEVKIDGPLSALTRQLFRYAGRPEIVALVVVVGKSTLGNLPPEILGKPVSVFFASRSFA